MCASVALIAQSYYKGITCEKTQMLMVYTPYISFDVGWLDTWTPGHLDTLTTQPQCLNIL